MKGIVRDDVVLVMAEADTVATALADLDEGTTIELDGEPVAILEDVPFGHKVALERVDEGDTVVKYGDVIGRATRRIERGEWVHTHNCQSTRGRGDLAETDGMNT